MRGFLPILLAVLFWRGSGKEALAEPIQARHARVELISAQENIVPGRQFWLGLHFSLEKDWHIYWMNPGDSGQPPVLQWQLPSGFTAGQIQWPLPEKLTRSTLADYGYQDDVMLLVPVRIASTLKSGDKADLALQAKWLICADVCIPDHAQLHLVLSVSSTPEQNPGEASIFSEARKRLPRAWPRSWKAWASSEKDDFVLSITTGTSVTAAEFFPLLPEQIENAAPQPVKAMPAGAKITLKKSEELLKPIHVLKGLLVLNGRESYIVDAPVTPAMSKAHND